MKQFQVVKTGRMKKSGFNLSHEKKLTMEMGNLTPILCQEVIPGDKFKVRSEHLIRFQPILAPIMHRINAFTHYFFVPHRLVWSAWEDFITGGSDGQQVPNFPVFTGTQEYAAAHMGIGSLADHIGVPSQQIDENETAEMPPISQLPFRAYQTIYNEYYRDQNLNPEIVVPTDSNNISYNSPAAPRLLSMRKRSWEKDYFTSALPWAQKGPQVNLPITGTMPVSGTPLLTKTDGNSLPDNTLEAKTGGMYAGANQVRIDALEAELVDVEASITDVRRMFALQKWFEKNARFGSRYIEQILSHFGVKSSDARLQRPEYLGGGRIPVQISEVLQTSQSNLTDGGTPQGTMSGHAITAGVAGFDRFFEEHGYIIGILSVMPRTAYYQGLPKHLTKFDRFDYFWPDFAHIGEQPVKKGELFLSDDPLRDETTFGFQERYAEYRSNPDTIHGDFRKTLEYWHLGRKFQAQPQLNGSFVQADPSKRVFAVVGGGFDRLLVNLYHDIKAVRPIPKFGTPM